MTRAVKSVSLDLEHYECASKKPNFSEWVRKKLKEEDTIFSNSHVTQALFDKKGICNPSAHPRCGICFPHAKPDMADIKLWNHNIIDNEELQARSEKNAPKRNSEAPENIDDSKNDLDSKEPQLRERKYIRRSLKYIWSFI